MKSLKEKVKARERICGTHISMGETYVADMFGMMGFDFVWVDTEHSLIDYDKLFACIRILKAHGTPVIVRAQMNNFNHTKKILEMGVDGIIFPNCDTKEYAKMCMEETLYPPLGRRGFGPVGAVEYGKINNSDYINNQIDNLCRFVQVESITAVKNLKEIIKNEYIDGYIFGPCDLSGTIGILGDIYNEENIKLIKEAIKILKENNKFVGVSVGTIDENEQKFWLDLGVDMISSGTDYDYIYRSASKNAKQLRKLLGKE